MTSDEVSARLFALINDNSQESAPDLAFDKTWNNISLKLLTSVQKILAK